MSRSTTLSYNELVVVCCLASCFLSGFAYAQSRPCSSDLYAGH